YNFEPLFVYSDPEDSSTMEYQSNLFLVFSEDMQPLQSGSGLIRLINDDTDQLVESFNPRDGTGSLGGTLVFDAYDYHYTSSDMLILDPAVDLVPGVNYLLLIDSDAL